MIERIDGARGAQQVIAVLEDIRLSGLRVAKTLSGMSEAEAREPSALPGWSRAHVVGHLVQSVDAYLWLTALARDGVEPGPRADRAEMTRALESLAARPVRELAAVLTDRLDRWFVEAESLPAERWDTLVRALAGWHHPAWYILLRCLRELETHHVDLAAGYRFEDWPASFVTWVLNDTLGTLATRGFPVARVKADDLGLAWEISDTGPVVTGAGYAVLGWLSGRRDGTGLCDDELPSPPPWPQPPLPGWG